jgi:hypothetical protein
MWCLVVALCHSGSANADDTSEIAKQAQNPIASAISVPFQNNATFDATTRIRIRLGWDAKSGIALVLRTPEAAGCMGHIADDRSVPLPARRCHTR